MVQDFYDYKEALKLGQKDYRAKTAKGESPYLPALDEIIPPFFMGPLITFFNVHVAQPLLGNRKSKSEQSS